MSPVSITPPTPMIELTFDVLDHDTNWKCVSGAVVMSQVEFQQCQSSLLHKH
jgi:hypothetical protein